MDPVSYEAETTGVSHYFISTVLYTRGKIGGLLAKIVWFPPPIKKKEMKTFFFLIGGGENAPWAHSFPFTLGQCAKYASKIKDFTHNSKPEVCARKFEAFLFPQVSDPP